MTRLKTMIFGGFPKSDRGMGKGFHIILMMGVLTISMADRGRCEQVTLDSEDQFGFAHWCMDQGEYYRAVGEFQRFCYLFPENKRIPEARLLMGVCYLRGAQYESARTVLEGVYRSYPEQTIGGQALFFFGETYYRQGAFHEAESYFQKVIEDYPGSELENAALYRLGWGRMKMDQWQDAALFFKEVGPDSGLYGQSLSLSNEALRGERLLQKNPATAGVMAALVPGMGHVYCGRAKDGVVAFLVNGLFVWAAVESFEHDQDVLGGILAFLEIGWYSGNIYSAVNCAHKYNRKVKDDFRKGLSERLDLNLFFSRQGHVGLSMQVRF
jgi:hypothetical protein